MRTDTFHEGEIEVQERAGERDLGRRNSAAIAPRITPSALSFLAEQRLVAVSAADAAGQLWTSVWCGAPGFVQSADGRRVTFHRRLTQLSSDDPVLGGLVADGDIGILAIELASRRRLRVNGTVRAIATDTIDIDVRESLPNCPKYIQRRRLDDEAGSIGAGVSESGVALDEERRSVITRTDTAFVGSLHPLRGIDTSHRGGPPGFIRVMDAATLRVPDYAGNGMFLTLGNYAVDPRASLAVLDFEHARVISFSGSARLHFSSDDPDQPTGGTGRYWDFTVERWVQFALPAAPQWKLIDRSPYNPDPPAR